MRSALVQRLEAVAQGLFVGCRMRVFGSMAMKIASGSSDVDLALTDLPPQCRPADVLIGFHDRLCETMLGQGRAKVSYEMELILRARVPILKLWDAHSGTECDISVLSAGMQGNFSKSRLIRVFNAIDPRLAPLLRFVKLWAKQHGLGDAKNGTLNSFGWTLLVVNFLQTTNPPVLPVLHANPDRWVLSSRLNCWIVTIHS